MGALSESVQGPRETVVRGQGEFETASLFVDPSHSLVSTKWQENPPLCHPEGPDWMISNDFVLEQLKNRKGLSDNSRKTCRIRLALFLRKIIRAD